MAVWLAVWLVGASCPRRRRSDALAVICAAGAAVVGWRELPATLAQWSSGRGFIGGCLPTARAFPDPAPRPPSHLTHSSFAVRHLRPPWRVGMRVLMGAARGRRSWEAKSGGAFFARAQTPSVLGTTGVREGRRAVGVDSSGIFLGGRGERREGRSPVEAKSGGAFCASASGRRGPLLPLRPHPSPRGSNENPARGTALQDWEEGGALGRNPPPCAAARMISHRGLTNGTSSSALCATGESGSHAGPPM